MNFLVIGCSYRTAPVSIRERLAFAPNRVCEAIDYWVAQDFETVILGTCNRVEIYLARPSEAGSLESAAVASFLAEYHGLPVEEVTPLLYRHEAFEAARHLFRVSSGLDSLVLGEGQIVGQVKDAYQLAQGHGSVGPALHALFQHGQKTAKRVRHEAGIGRGHVSVASVAIDYIREVFDRFDDKTVLVIGSGKIGELTVNHLKALQLQRILIANRSEERARAIAQASGGRVVPWRDLDRALVEADIVLSTTGAPEPIVTLERYAAVASARAGRPIVILDIAVPRDFDPRIHDGDLTCLFNIDDLERVRQRTLAERMRRVPEGEAIVEEEARRFWKEWARRQYAPVIAQLTQDMEAKRLEIVAELLRHLDGRLTDKDRALIEGAFRLLQNRFLHGPLSALAENAHEQTGSSLLDALRKLFRLEA